MNYNNLTSAEKTYYANLTDDERKLYLADQTQLDAISTWTTPSVQMYVSVAYLVEEIYQLHESRARLMDTTRSMLRSTDEDKQLVSDIMETSDKLFAVTIAIGDHSAVLSLADAEENDELCGYLARVKMLRFELLATTFDIGVLIETLQLHEVY